MVIKRRPIPDEVRERIAELLTSASQPAQGRAAVWAALEDAHVLSQPWALTHTRVHWAMLTHAARSRDRSEVLGQLSRLLLAAPGSLSGRYPAGNTGRANVSLSEPMPIREELATLLAAEGPETTAGVLDSEEAKRLYDRIAPVYDLAAAPFRLLRGRRLADQAIEELRLELGDTVVDLGTGTGWNLPRLAERVGPSGRVIGVDISPDMLDQARNSIGDIAHVELVEADISTYQPPRETSAVISTFAIEMRPDYDAIIKRLAGSIQPGGRIAVTGLRHADHWPSWLSNAGSRLMRFFGVNDDYRSHRPWQAIQTHTTDTNYSETHAGVVYLAAGTTVTTQEAPASTSAEIERH